MSSRRAVRIGAVLLALMALAIPGWGAIDLGVSWSAEWNPVLSGGWGLFFTVLVAVPFGVVAIRPGGAAPSIWVLWVAVAALALAAALGREPELVVLVVWLAGGTACVALPSVAERWRPLEPDGGWVAALGAAAVSSPWLAYAWWMSANNRQGRSDTDVSSGVDHYSVQAALGIAMVLLAVLATVWRRGRRQLGIHAGSCAIYLGILAYHWDGYPGAMSPFWAVLAVAWGLTLIAWAWASTRVHAFPSAPADAST